MARSVRVTMSLPTETAEALASIARRLHITRSALVADLLSEPVAMLAQFVALVPAGPVTDGDVKRFRGASIDLIQRQIAQVQEQAKDLDPEPKLL